METPLSMPSRAARSGFAATISRRSERVGETGLEERSPAHKLSFGVCIGGINDR
jgi:hypothetical protein